MDYLGKEEMLTNRDVNKCVYMREISFYTVYERYIGEKYVFCEYGTFLGSFISAHETCDQHITCCVYISVQYIKTL